MVAQLLTAAASARTMTELFSVMRHGPDRLLHGIRRRHAVAAVRQRPLRSILVLCHGNICRSPYAAAALARLLAPVGVEVSSAGFVGAERCAPRAALAAALERGIDLRSHLSRVITPEMLRAADVVVVMDPGQARDISSYARRVVVLGDFDPSAIMKRSIRDPWRMPQDVFAEVFTRIDRCATALAEAALA